MFQESQWDGYLRTGKWAASFDEETPDGYFSFGECDMIVNRCVDGTWMHKKVHDWRSKNCQAVNAQLEEQDWTVE